MMTKEKFIDLVEKRLKEKKNNLNEQDIIDIGIAHRELPKVERDWSSVAKMIHWNGSGESLRHFVLRKLKDKDMILSNEETDENIAKKKALLYRERQQVRDEWSTYHRMLREDARLETLKETIKESARRLEPFRKSSYKGPKTTDVEAIAMISDLHIGVEFDDFCNKYNLEIAKRRVSKLVDDIRRYCTLHKVRRLNVCNLGDLISGIIHTTIRLEQEFDVIDQVMNASEILAGILNDLQDVAPEVIYRSCTDNHSRAIANKNEAVEKENFYRLIDWYVEERLKDTSVKFVNDNLSKEIGKFELLNSKKVMFAHGHNDNTNKVFQSFIGATEEYIHYVLLGHYHCEKVKNFQNMRVFINGSIVGTDDYAASKRLYTKPSQMLLVFDRDNVVHYSINLDI